MTNIHHHPPSSMPGMSYAYYTDSCYTELQHSSKQHQHRICICNLFFDQHANHVLHFHILLFILQQIIPPFSDAHKMRLENLIWDNWGSGSVFSSVRFGITGRLGKNFIRRGTQKSKLVKCLESYSCQDDEQVYSVLFKFQRSRSVKPKGVVSRCASYSELSWCLREAHNRCTFESSSCVFICWIIPRSPSRNPQ